MAGLRSTPPLDQRNKKKGWPICWCCDLNYSTIYIIKADQCSMKLKLHTVWTAVCGSDGWCDLFLFYSAFLVPGSTCYFVMVRFDASLQTGKTKVTIRALCAAPKNWKKLGPRPGSFHCQISSLLLCVRMRLDDCTSWKNMQPNSALASKLWGKTTQNQTGKKELLQNETSMWQLCYSYLQSFGEMS